MAHETSKLDDRIEAFTQGREAYEAGQPESANPYDSRSLEHFAWSDGWAEGAHDDGRGTEPTP